MRWREEGREGSDGRVWYPIYGEEGGRERGREGWRREGKGEVEKRIKGGRWRREEVRWSEGGKVGEGKGKIKENNCKGSSP